MNDDARALLICGAILFGAGNGSGYVGARMTAPAAPAEVRFVHVPAAQPLAPPVEVAPIEPKVTAPAEPAPIPAVEPPAAAPAPVDAKPPLPQPRPKVDAKPRSEKDMPAKKSRPPAKRALPSCAIVKREYERMSWPERMAEYRKATPEEIAHGKRCLGF